MSICSKQLLMAFILMLGSNEMGTIAIYTSPTGKTIREIHQLTESSLKWSFYNSVTYLFGIAGPFYTKFFLSFCKGRRKIAIVAIDVLSTFSWLMNCTIKKYFWLGVFARGLLGISMGAFSSIIPMFLVEIAPLERRGFFGSLNQVGVVIGQCLFSFLGSSVDYLGLNYIGASISFLQLLLIYFVNETPNIPNEALISEGFTEVSTSQTVSGHKSICQKKYLDGLFVSIMLLFFLQFSGIGGILTNLSDIMSSAGLDFDPNYQSGISVLSQLISVFIGSLLMDKLGRQKIWIISSVIAAIALLLMALNEKLNISNIFPLICIFTYLFGFSLGLGPIPWFIVAEYFTEDDIRPTATMICMSCNWMFAFVTILAFPSMKEKMKMFGVLIFFFIMCICSLMFGIFKVKEPHERSKEFEPI